MSFSYLNGYLACEAYALTDLAAAAGTPAYVYSLSCLRQHAHAYLERMPVGGLICYAVKANGNPHLLQRLASWGVGADVTSGGELYLALQAGIPAQKILFSGVGKTMAEIKMALEAGIKALHVESEMELTMIRAAAVETGRVAPIALRINPDIAADTHAYISTGGKADKFGIPAAAAMPLLQQAAENQWLQPVGLAAHIGSQITDLAPYRRLVHFLLDLAAQAAAADIALTYIDVGGGLGIDYQAEAVPSITEWMTAVTTPIAAAGFQPVVEPGRSLVGPCGCLLTSVTLTKEQGGKRFVVVDAGMHTLIRPTLYHAYHPVLPVRQAEAVQQVDIVGPICESGDWLARERRLPLLQPGDLLALTHAGAYGYAMSSNYNARLKPAELLVDGGDYQIIRPRQSWSDLL